ncbi:hypothetical protein DB29_01934 [Shouchella clausii]|nr:hypothetical protein DB29_01934 [Shouchella clausii]
MRFLFYSGILFLVAKMRCSPNEAKTKDFIDKRRCFCYNEKVAEMATKSFEN